MQTFILVLEIRIFLDKELKLIRIILLRGNMRDKAPLEFIKNGLLNTLGTSFFGFIPDSMYLKFKYRLKFGEKLNLNNPGTLNEKIQWIKLNIRDKSHSFMVDKVAVREYIAKTIGEDYLVPLIGIWDSVDDIDFDALPSKYIIKCTHDSGSFLKCKDKSNFDVKKAKKWLKRKQRTNYYYKSREWLYKEVTPKIICEELLLEEDGSDIVDFKTFCFDGTMRFLIIKYYVNGELRRQSFDRDWNPIETPENLKSDARIFKKPQGFEDMVRISEKLSAGLPQLRVDLYNVKGKVYFGEMTYYHGSGFMPLGFDDLERKAGDWLVLPKV